jgi:hypothetical protein
MSTYIIKNNTIIATLQAKIDRKNKEPRFSIHFWFPFGISHLFYPLDH